jgi:hypothetical protein
MISPWKHEKHDKEDFVLRLDKGFSEMKDLFDHGRQTLTPVEGQNYDEWSK